MVALQAMHLDSAMLEQAAAAAAAAMAQHPVLLAAALHLFGHLSIAHRMAQVLAARSDDKHAGLSSFALDALCHCPSSSDPSVVPGLRHPAARVEFLVACRVGVVDQSTSR